ncbi:hypothetical protein NQ318_002490 [Aromia moschata]|uniref:Uncharacterized protein n=1 Tax=Aromia moschata TaxID=1265417 RepID=A0AAV8Y6Q5_9CUCU|nr:hypothetical protein NQ318_002490 [Aromia moschata]
MAKEQQSAPSDKLVVPDVLPLPKPKPPIYENVDFKVYSSPPVEFITSDIMVDPSFSLSSPLMEPPKVKPPPPPPLDEEELQPQHPMKRINSTKRIKKEIHIKRSSFLGLDGPTDDQIDPDIPIEKPPDGIQAGKVTVQKIQEENRMGVLSKVESQDSGLDIDRGRLSSDTWCSSVGDSSIPSHERQDSEQTNSITSEEDEITKKRGKLSRW